MRLVEVDDADYILSLRINPAYNNFLSSVDGDLESQIKWIKDYKKDELEKKQFYFIIERLDGTRCGTVRIYDISDESFCWGSWILDSNKTKYAAVESAFLIYEFGFNILKCNQSHFEVMNDNSGVIKFHRRMGAELINQDEENHYFIIRKDQVMKSKEELAHLL